MMMNDPTWAPDTCTLPTAERPLRRAEFDELFTTAVHDADRLTPTHLWVSLHGSEDLEPLVRDLVARETDCCTFFAFAVTTTGPGSVTLDIMVDEPHVSVLDAIADRVVASRRSVR